MAVGRFGGQLQLAVHVVEQFFGFLGVTVEVPLVGPLGLFDFFPGLLAQTLGRGEIGVAFAGDVALRPLGDGNSSEEEHGTEDST